MRKIGVNPTRIKNQNKIEFHTKSFCSEASKYYSNRKFNQNNYEERFEVKKLKDKTRCRNYFPKKKDLSFDRKA